MHNRQPGPHARAQSFDFLVFIGRFQPFHLGHQKVIATALEQAQRVIVLIGSSRTPPSLRNPWTFAERKRFIKASFSADDQARIAIAPLMDCTYNDQLWLRTVQQTVNGIVCQYPGRIDSHAAPRIGLIGHDKDHSSYYLSMFPHWSALNVAAVEALSATPIREAYFGHGEISTQLSSGVQALLQQYQQTEAYQQIAAEQVFIRDYRKGWEQAPYPPVFVTVDAVVVQAGHVLLIERKARPGKGQLALPGGFIGTDEPLEAAVIRELREETRIKVPAPVLKGNISQTRVFDDPHRSTRGRTITHAYRIELPDNAEGLPRVKGSDDARHAFWLPLAELEPEKLYEDHYFIIQNLLGSL